MKNPWQTLSGKVHYDNPWISVTENQVINPGGGKGIYGVVHFKNLAIGIIPLDEEMNTWIVGQYRYTLNLYSWEMPEGGGMIGKPPLEAAKRELLEETGIIARNWTELLTLYTSNSVTDEFGIAYLARNLSFGQAQPEETEDLKVRKLPFEELVNMVLSGEITDAFTICAVLKAKLLLDKGLLF